MVQDRNILTVEDVIVETHMSSIVPILTLSDLEYNNNGCFTALCLGLPG